MSKVIRDVRRVLELVGIEDGATISFHHHLRDGDSCLLMIMDAIAEMGVKELVLAPSSLTNAHERLVDYIRDGTISKIYTSGLRGRLGRAISEGIMDTPVVIRSHGGRARAIESGDVNIDVAFVAVSEADEEGNANGLRGRNAFGSLGYALVDVRYAKKVVLITDNLKPFPLDTISIPQYLVDYVLVVDSIGDNSKIATGTTRLTRNPLDLRIAHYSAEVIANSGYLAPNFSFQTGASGAALATAMFVRDRMLEKGIKGNFVLGGITSYMVQMLEEGLFSVAFDVQSFDAAVTSSILKNHNHIEIDASFYANPRNKGCLVNRLDVVVLGAMEIDTDFNVNVLTGFNGVLQGASGGHEDTAFGSKLTVVVAPSFRMRIPTVKDRVSTVVTPGRDVDVFVTERGIAVNPRREELFDRLLKAGLPVMDMHSLKKKVESITGVPSPVTFGDKTVAIVEYRDGSVIDEVKQVA